MAKRKRYVKPVSKYADEAILYSGKVLKIEEQNTLIKDKFKTAFYCSSNQIPEGRLCISWDRTNFEVGDELDMKGRFSDGTFLVWSMIIRKRQNPTEYKPSPQLQELRNKLQALKTGVNYEQQKI